MEIQETFEFIEIDWETPNTYDRNFRTPPTTSGVYLITVLHIDSKNRGTYEIVYVGSAKNLLQRYGKHEVLRIVREDNQCVQFYFKEVENYREVEKNLIRIIQPKYNKQWR